MGVRFGRYHIFLHKLIKPEPVIIRTLLWKNYHQKYFKLKPPTFGLNFIEDTDNRNKNFMLLCGFEKFDNYFVRIDILERLFMQIINSGSDENKEIKLVPEMLNLLGCSKENFIKFVNTFKKIKPLVCFAAKSNSNLSILRSLGKLGAGTDVVSVGELIKALKAGIKPNKIVFSGVGKTDEELKIAINKKILLINCESESEAKLINNLAKKLRKKGFNRI